MTNDTQPKITVETVRRSIKNEETVITIQANYGKQGYDSNLEKLVGYIQEVLKHPELIQCQTCGYIPSATHHPNCTKHDLVCETCGTSQLTMEGGKCTACVNREVNEDMRT